jgi:hypothetical protein
MRMKGYHRTAMLAFAERRKRWLQEQGCTDVRYYLIDEENIEFFFHPAEPLTRLRVNFKRESEQDGQ